MLQNKYTKPKANFLLHQRIFLRDEIHLRRRDPPSYPTSGISRAWSKKLSGAEVFMLLCYETPIVHLKL